MLILDLGSKEKFSGGGSFMDSRLKFSKDFDFCSFFIPLVNTLCRLGEELDIGGCCFKLWYVLEDFVCENRKKKKGIV